MAGVGIRVDASTYLASVTEQARKDQAAAIQRFLDWASKMTPNGCFINPSSAAQIQTLLFGGMENSKTREPIPDTRTFKVIALGFVGITTSELLQESKLHSL